MGSKRRTGGDHEALADIDIDIDGDRCVLLIMGRFCGRSGCVDVRADVWLLRRLCSVWRLRAVWLWSLCQLRRLRSVQLLAATLSAAGSTKPANLSAATTDDPGAGPTG